MHKTIMPKHITTHPEKRELTSIPLPTASHFMMKAYITEQMTALRSEVEEQNRKHLLNTHNICGKQVIPFKPIPQQIEELLRSLPEARRNRPWAMTDFVAFLTGKYRAHPHPQQIAQALLKLGWVRRRIWAKGYDGSRLWLPPKP